MYVSRETSLSRRLGTGGDGGVILAGWRAQGLPVFHQTKNQRPSKTDCQNAIDPGENPDPALIADQLFLFRQLFPAVGSFPDHLLGLDGLLPVGDLDYNIGLHRVFFHTGKAFFAERAL